MANLDMYMEGLIGQQADALHMVANAKKGSIIRIIGYAGTGKTYVMARILDYLDEVNSERFIFDRQNIFVGAPTHQAKKVLRNKVKSTNITISTIHSGMAMKKVTDEHGNEKFVPDKQLNLFGMNSSSCEVERADVVVCEEASMMSVYMGKLLMDMWKSSRFTLILVGDDAQAPPVDGKVSYFFTDDFTSSYQVETVRMTDVIRQGVNSPILDLATEIRNNLFIDRDSMAKLIRKHIGIENESGFILPIKGNEFSKTLIPIYTSEYFSKNHNHVKCIAYNRNMAAKYANFVRTKISSPDAARYAIGDLIIFNAAYDIPDGMGQSIDNNNEFMIDRIVPSSAEFFGEMVNVDIMDLIDLYSGKRISNVVVPNISELDKLQQVMAKKSNVIKKIGNANERKFAWKQFYNERDRIANVSWLYGITTHKSQGSTYTYTLVDVGNLLGGIREKEERNRLLYTAITRASTGIYVKID